MSLPTTTRITYLRKSPAIAETWDTDEKLAIIMHLTGLHSFKKGMAQHPRTLYLQALGKGIFLWISHVLSVITTVSFDNSDSPCQVTLSFRLPTGYLHDSHRKVKRGQHI